MLRPGALVAMRKQGDQPALVTPLGLARCDELVDDHLRVVDEVAELRFPEHEIAAAAERVAVFETEDGFLRQHRFED